MSPAFLIPLLCATFLVGCTHHFTVTPRQGGAQGQGRATEVGSRVTLTLHEQTYTGFYVYGEAPITFFNIVRGIPAVAASGPQTTPVVGSGGGTAYVLGAGNGRLFATTPTGEAIRCEFHALSRHSRGLCQDNAGHEYDLHIHRSVPYLLF
jgi:hypothetical protein